VHGLNNPLAALLAEAQLLQFEPLAAEHAAAIERMIELCRRIARTVRELEEATRAATR
jgi:signal transduction histidine kinase